MSDSWGLVHETKWLEDLGEYAEKNRVRLSKMSAFAARDFKIHLLKKYIEANDYRKDRWVIEAVKHAKELIRKIKEGLYPVALQSTADPQIEDSGTSVLSSQLLSSSKRKSFEKKYPSLAKQMV